ncbi:ribonuclease T2 family protein [Pseudomonas sp. NY15181]|uniref:ribonuclease T2 family protein n=1 Tax=Pseudomonas sp. NY15181 TaxID=3400349 RepID=UPI003A88928D
MKHITAALFVAFLLSLGAKALAVEASQGTFTVSTQCEAYQSFKKQTNPDSLQVQPGEVFRINEVNKADYQWVRLQVQGDLRWVSAACGTVEGLEIAEGNASACRIPDTYDSYVLALTWQPGFCLHHRGGADKPECKAMQSGQLVVSNFTLHGLWPNKSQCGKDYGNCANAPDLKLSANTVDYISPWMPNFYYGTQFGHYEWKKHGACQTAMADDAYFRFAVDLVKSFNDSPAGQYVRDQAGGAISQERFYAEVNREFGNEKAANNFLLICSGDYLEEIRIALPKDLKESHSVNTLIGDTFAPARQDDRKACRSDRVLIEAKGYRK